MRRPGEKGVRLGKLLLGTKTSVVFYVGLLPLLVVLWVLFHLQPVAPVVLPLLLPFAFPSGQKACKTQNDTLN